MSHYAAKSVGKPTKEYGMGVEQMGKQCNSPVSRHTCEFAEKNRRFACKRVLQLMVWRGVMVLERWNGASPKVCYVFSTLLVVHATTLMSFR